MAAATYAQDAAVVTPALGYVFDEGAQALRAVRGLPGAALVEDPLDTGFPIRSAAISPKRNFALASAGDSSVRLLRFQNNGAAASLLEGAMPLPDRMLLSSGGSTALLYRDGRLQSVSGLPERPAVRDWNTSFLFDAGVPMAISDDARLIVLAPGGGDPAAVQLLSSDGGSSRMPMPGSIVALAFHRSRRDLLALTADGDLCLVRDAGADTPCRIFQGAAAPDGTAVQFSPDGARAYIAAAGGNLSIVDLDTGDVVRLACGCRASSLDPTTLEMIFRLSPVGDSPLLLFDASQLAPRVWFVPRGGRRSEGGSR
jgi:hypothetical protein